jgi:hypothetical protein
MAKGEKKTGLIGVRLEPDLLATVEAAAENEERPLSAMARILIKEALEAREVKEKERKPANRKR